MEALLVWGLILLALAFAVVVIDLFLPSAGILAAVAAVLAIGGVVCLFRYSPAWGISGALAVLIGGPALFVVGFKMMPHTPVGRRLILGASDPQPPGPPADAQPLSALIGSEGTVVTDLRPVGTVRVGDTKFEAVSETTLIRAGASVRITGADGLSLRVRPA